MKTTLTMVGMTSFVPVITIGIVLFLTIPASATNIPPLMIAMCASGGFGLAIFFMMLDISRGITRKYFIKTICAIYTATALALGLQAATYSTAHYHSGGDVDPIAYMTGKTSSVGGYYYFVDKITQRKHFVSDQSFLALPFSEYELANYAPSIAEIKQHHVSAGIWDAPNGYMPQVTMTLEGGVAHLSYDEERLKQLFDTKDYRPDIASLAAEKLKRLGEPVFKYLKDFPPVEGSFSIPIPPEELSLDDLQEKYGLHIVASKSPPILHFRISYPSRTEYSPIFKDEQLRKILAQKTEKPE